MADTDPLASYRQKRNFAITPEPQHEIKTGDRTSPQRLQFVVQKHWARSVHYDFRLEFDGTLKSWAVPKGPCLDPHVKRMAVEVEDHPLSYGDFEGEIPANQYGAGRVIVWDSGIWLPTVDAVQGFKDGKLKFELQGHKLKGHWTLIRMRKNSDIDGEKQIAWLLIKEHDQHEKPFADYDITTALPDSIYAAGTKSEIAGRQAVPAVPKTRGLLPPHAREGMPDGAVKAGSPPTLAPQLATLVDSPPAHGNWLYELKFDGYRLLARLDKGSVTCLTRTGQDWTEKMPQLAQSLAGLNLSGTWLDGEIVVLNGQGIPQFQLLQQAFEAQGENAAAGITWYVFDIPFYQGYDLRNVPLNQRRALLENLIENQTSSNIRFSAAFDAPTAELVQSACKLGLEGVIGKRAESPYVSGRTRDWIKLKCTRRQSFSICGYTDPKGARTGFGALLLGQRDDDGALQYVGNVGTGFNEATLAGLLRTLVKLVTPDCPFAGNPTIAGRPHWVKPALLADVSFAEWTNAGRIRHGVFMGLLDNGKPPMQSTESASKKPAVKRFASVKPSQAACVVLPASLRLTHADRVIDRQSGLTKMDVVKHYAAVAALMLPHLKGRPVSLVRAPDGTGGELFFQKHAKAGEIAGIQLLDTALDPGHANLLAIANSAGLLNAVQMNTLEFHSWNAVATSIAKPDRMIFDIDPGENVGWLDIQEAALLVRTLVEALGLKTFIKTSGGKGLHLVVPLKKLHSWDTVKGFSQAVVEHLAKTIPQKFVAKSGPKNRVGKVFVDYLRNGFGATTVCAWSARARPGLGVSVPIAWEELQTVSSGAHWTLKNIAERLDLGNSVWDDYKRSAQNLGSAMKALNYGGIRQT